MNRADFPDIKPRVEHVVRIGGLLRAGIIRQTAGTSIRSACKPDERGWFVADESVNGRGLEIQRDDDMALFSSDIEALRAVEKAAQHGDEYAMEALYCCLTQDYERWYAFTSLEWSGYPNPENPDNEWIDDATGRVIPAE